MFCVQLSLNPPPCLLSCRLPADTSLTRTLSVLDSHTYTHWEWRPLSLSLFLFISLTFFPSIWRKKKRVCREKGREEEEELEEEEKRHLLRWSVSAEFDFVQSFSWSLHRSGKSGTLGGKQRSERFIIVFKRLGSRWGGRDTNVFLFHRVKNLSGWVILGILSKTQSLGGPVWFRSMCHFGCQRFFEVRSQLFFSLLVRHLFTSWRRRRKRSQMCPYFPQKSISV